MVFQLHDKPVYFWALHKMSYAVYGMRGVHGTLPARWNPSPMNPFSSQLHRWKSDNASVRWHDRSVQWTVRWERIMDGPMAAYHARHDVSVACRHGVSPCPVTLPGNSRLMATSAIFRVSFPSAQNKHCRCICADSHFQHMIVSEPVLARPPAVPPEPCTVSTLPLPVAPTVTDHGSKFDPLFTPAAAVNVAFDRSR